MVERWNMSHLSEMSKLQLIQRVLFLEKRVRELESKTPSEPDKTSVAYKRGFADGTWKHPPAEITLDYMHGYAEGLKQTRTL